jgi:hypothetical protein
MWLTLPLMLLLAGGARAQDVFNAGDTPNTSGDTPNALSDTFSTSCLQALQPNIWKQLGVNPLACHPQSMAQDSQGQCSLKGATQVAHQGTMCYYCVPQVPPGTLYIPMDQVQNASVQGYTCGESPVDPGCMAVCSRESSSSTSTYVPPAAQSTTGGGGPLPATGSNDPCHPYDTSSAAGRAAADANVAAYAAACNAERCAHNPDLDVCKTVVDNGQPGSKGINLTPEPGQPSTGGKTAPPPPPPPPVDFAALDRAMAACMNAKLSFTVPSALPQSYRNQAIGLLPASFRGTPFAKLSSAQQIAVEAQGMALQAQVMFDQKYHSNDPEDDVGGPREDAAMDFLAGYLTNCLFKAGDEVSLTEEPFVPYDNLIGVPPGLSNPRAKDFTQGWMWSNMGLNPTPLMPPAAPAK